MTKADRRPRRILLVTTPEGGVELWSNIRALAEHYNLASGTIRTYLYRAALRYRYLGGAMQYHREPVKVFGFQIKELFINNPVILAECTDSCEPITASRKTKNKATKDK